MATRYVARTSALFDLVLGLLVLPALLIVAMSVLAQTAGSYDLRWWTADAGRSQLEAGSYTLRWAGTTENFCLAPGRRPAGNRHANARTRTGHGTQRG
jgi:hypothetical protein